MLIEGPSGAGKSDLALRLIDRGAVLVSDDRTAVMQDDRKLIARAPSRMAGRIEVRGVGIVSVPHVDSAPVALIIRLGAEAVRLPEPRTRRIAGMAIREVVVDPFRASAPLKVEWALRDADMERA